jgi:hypothetical protein
MTISFRQESAKISTYSTSEVSEYQLKRLITIGDVAKIVLKNEDAIENEILDARKEFGTKTVSQKLWDLEKEIKALKKEDQLELDEQLLVEAEGRLIEFPEKEFWYKANDRYTRIIGLKITGKSKSGKTFDIRIDWKSGDQKIQHDIYRVKKEYLLTFLRK